MAPKRQAAIDTGLQFGLRNRWYPIFESRDLPAGKPIGIRRLGEGLALWRDGSGTAHVFIDRCPHRGAAFSEGGTVHGEELHCWYHGFRYDGSGQCVGVPVEGEQTALANRVSITSYPVEERWGMSRRCSRRAPRCPRSRFAFRCGPCHLTSTMRALAAGQRRCSCSTGSARTAALSAISSMILADTNPGSAAVPEPERSARVRQRLEALGRSVRGRRGGLI